MDGRTEGGLGPWMPQALPRNTFPAQPEGDGFMDDELLILREGRPGQPEGRLEKSLRAALETRAVPDSLPDG